MTKHYPQALVGEQFYQQAIARCQVGDIIDVSHERGNPVDPRAIVARRRDGGETIGYIPRDSFVQRVMHEDGESVAAAISGIFTGRRGFTEVTLLVSVLDEPADEVTFRPSEAEDYRDPEPAAWRPTPAPDPEPDPMMKISPLQIGIGVAILLLLVRCMT